MAPAVATQNGGGSSGEEDAKHVLDKFGQQVYETVKKEAEAYKEALKGDLSNAKFENEPKGPQTENDPCKLDYQYHTNVTSGFGREYPCRTGKEERFSQVHGGECDEKKIRGSNGKSEGACAPYRRLHLCVRNLENISALHKINKDTLLADVCLAALHEGQSITQDYPKYQIQYASTYSPSQICTMLARSFADIGDIIRGKDLYRGVNGNDKLESNLKKIFGKIYSDVTSDKNGKNGAALKTRYDGDTTNYYQLREDWWNANRLEVWKAITCNAAVGNEYFRATCGSGKTATQASNKCRCPNGTNETDQVPTYFDYVPQFLRWFEEWAEDFCTKRKHKLENAKEQCRKPNGEDKYCDFNGYDCKGTASGKHKYRWDNACAGCLFSCSDFRKWIAKQKEEFEKQKKKCEKEIGKAKNTTQVPNGNISNIYEKEFYTHLEEKYKTVDAFLNLLNKETTCQGHPEVKKKTSINFNDQPEDIFSPTEYCEPCPWCGIKKENRTWERINNHSACPEEELYTPKNKVIPTKINVLTSGKGETEIKEKLDAFCKTPNGNSGQTSSSGSGDCGGTNSDSSLCEPWKCYKGEDVMEPEDDDDQQDYENMKNAGGLCILETTKGDKSGKKQKTYNDFFNFWVAHVLNDSIDWRKQLTKCLSEDKLKKCEKGCKSNCECFKKWIEKKEKEWEKIKEHFKKQKGIPGGLSHYNLLETILEEYYFKNIQKAYGDLKSIQEMKKMIKENKQNKNRTKDDVDALDVLFDHELEEAEDCLDIHEDDDDDDECVEESEKIPNNPCSGTRHRAMVKNVAADMYRAARQQLGSRAGGRRTLKADATKGTYRKGGKADELNNICKITDEHSNDSRSHGEPCHGKDKEQNRFKVGTEWSNVEDKKTTSYEDVYLPPRRQHMCTSNLENLDVGSVTENGKAIHSLLGDVLLSANHEAKKIKELYEKNKVKSGQNDKNGLTDKKTVCRAMKYSFADLGDIIRGRDLWDDNNDAKSLQTNLKAIFKKIKEKHPGIEGNNKYVKDNENKQLRSDWWTANRRQVWRAMKCALKSEKINCGRTPYDDYIPQRLRWMTEWAEWYCKAQNKYYGELETDCGSCTGPNKYNCTRDTEGCKTCTEACKEYKTKIQPWKDQWNNMLVQYLLLYKNAETTSRHGIGAYGGAVGDKDIPVVDFLQELQEANKSSASKRSKRSTDGTTTDPTLTSPYSTADRYIHQEIGNVG